jgi:uncharacterized protein (TIGR02466 family)
MNVETYKLFPTLVLKIKNFLSEEQCEDVFDFCLKQNNKEHPVVVGNGTSSHHCNYDLLEKIETNVMSCSDITQKILRAAKQYTDTAGLRQVGIIYSWFNIQNKNSNLFHHMHPGSILSSALFINCDEDSSKLFFYNPNLFVNYMNEYDNKNYTEYTYTNFGIKPEMGDLVLFPGWLFHGSHKDLNGTANRMIVGCNFKY